VAHYIKPDWFNRNLLNPTVRAFTRLGFSVWGSRILRVRGRKSGEMHSHPVNLLTYQGHQYLVSPRGHTQWVRNMRVSGEGELVLGSRTQRFKAVEMTDDERVPLLREYLRRWKFEVGMFFGGVSAESSDEELRRIAPDHPAFRVEPV
jgi:deazaflavin-dependent oxidoreductase (nitroreductase family)